METKKIRNRSFLVGMLILLGSFSLWGQNYPGNFYQRLPLMNPSSAAEFIGEAYSRQDFLAVLFAMDPELQKEASMAIMQLRLERFIQKDLMGDVSYFFENEEEHGNFLVSLIFDRIMRLAAEKNALNMDLSGFRVRGNLQYIEERPPAVLVPGITNQNDEVQIRLVQSPSGRWRLDNAFGPEQSLFQD